jgi:holo-[acyl-carrier protein] synthase
VVFFVFDTIIVQYIGIDIVEISRIQKAVKEHGEKFLRRIYTGREIKLYRNSISSLAARFAAKEAVMKALGSGDIGFFANIEVLSEPSGRPFVILHDKVKVLADSVGIKDFSISLSHSRDSAVAVVVGNLERK